MLRETQINYTDTLIEKGFVVSPDFATAIAGPKTMRASERRLLVIEFEGEEYQALLVHDGEGAYDIRYPKRSMITDLLAEKLEGKQEGEAAFKLATTGKGAVEITFLA